MNPAALCIKQNRITIVALVLIALAGIRTFRAMPRLEDPEFTIREAVVITLFPGASPERVESLVTDTLETRIRELPEVERIRSQSRTNVSILNVTIKEDISNLQPVWQRLRNKVNDALPELPEGVRPPDVHDDFGDVFGILLSLRGDGFTPRELQDHAEELRNHLRRIPSIARIELHGIQEERIFVEISNTRLANLGVSPFMLARMLQAQNAIQPGGDALVAGQRIVIEPTGEFQTVEEIRNATLRLPGVNQAVTLGDIAEVTRGYIDPAAPSVRFQGEPAILLAISMVSGENIMHLGEEVRALTAELGPRLPLGLELEEVYFQPDYVERSISDFMWNLGLAVVLVFVTMLVFTGLRTGLIAGAILPMAVLLSIALMPTFGVDLEMVSIASLIIAMGLLVSNGIVVSENILVRMTSGQDRLAAATGAVRELAIPMLASQLTTIFAFMPIVTAKSAVGEYTRSLFVVVSLSLLGSWVLALTFTPFLSHAFQRPAKVSDRAGALVRAYQRLLFAGLRHRVPVALAVVAATLLSFWGFRFVPSIFFPPMEREMMLVELHLPSGSDISVTESRVIEIESLLRGHPEVVSIASLVGSGGPRWYLSLAPEPVNPGYGMLMVTTQSPRDVDRLTPLFRDQLAESFPELRIDVSGLEMGPPVGAPIQLRVSGEDMDELYAAADQVRETLARIPGVFNLHDDWGEWSLKMVVDVRQDQAKRAGLTSEDISVSLLTQMTGVPVTQFRETGNLIPVVMRAQAPSRGDLGNLEGLHVFSFATGQNIPLQQVASTRLVWQPSMIHRRDGTRTLTLKAHVTGRLASEALAELLPQLEALTTSADWPAGFDLTLGGENEESEKAQQSILDGVPLAAALLFLVLLAQFNSIRATVVVILTILPMMIGITPGMLLSRTTFGFMAMLGLISLAGIIVNNAILLLDRIRTEQRGGLSPADAIVAAALKRFRPILLMALTAIIGLLPLALRGGALWVPMANVMIFGLITATVLGLILTPVLYALFFGVSFKNHRWDPEQLKVAG